MKSIVVIIILILILCFILGYYCFSCFQEGLENQTVGPAPVPTQNNVQTTSMVNNKNMGQMGPQLVMSNAVSPSVTPSSLINNYQNVNTTTHMPTISTQIATTSPAIPTPMRTDYGTNVAQHCLTIKNTIDTLKSLYSKLTPQEQTQVQAEILGLEKIQFILRC